MESHLLPFSENGLHVEFLLDILEDNADSESIVLRFVEEIPIELDDVGVGLRLEKLDCFFLKGW